MAATRAVSTSIAGATTNASGNVTTGTVVSIATSYGATVSVVAINGGTLTTPARFDFYGSSDNFASAGKKFYSITTDTASGAILEESVDVPIGFAQVRVDLSANTGNSVQCEAFVHVLTGI